MLAPGALAASSFTWAGVSTASEDWSVGQDWEGGTAPKSSTPISLLTFPHLGSSACVNEPRTHPCYFSFDDLGGLEAETLQIDDANSYLIGGEELDLGAGGLHAAPEGGEGKTAGDFLDLPFHLTATQTWSVANPSGGEVDQNGVLLGGKLTGAATSALTVDQSNGSAFLLDDNANVGPVTFEGANAGGEHDANGSVFLEGEVNASDREPVSLRQIFFAGIGATGPLTADDSTLVVGSGFEPAESLEAASVGLSPSTALVFEITGSGAIADVDYSQLLSHGAVELDNAEIGVVAHPGEEGAPCPTVTPGEQFTFISTSGALTGAFANAPEGGAEIPIHFEGCGSTHTMQIAYRRTGGTETVTGTVEPPPVTAPSQTGPPPAGTTPAQEEAKGAVLSSKETREGSPSATVADTSLLSSRAGVVKVKVECPSGVSYCVGTVTLHTARAVTASSAGGHRRSILTLAASPFTIAGGHSATVTLRLSGRARALLARSHSLKVRVTIFARDPQGAGHTAQMLLTLRAAKPRRR
ncbi:MAG TPA: hypothetical protein VGY13_11910 [Solirubrobacteraceae bacterium]|nr:hypothetical protein [Solirubrobacteraceae bacterium]